MILFLLPSIAHLADFRDIGPARGFPGFPGHYYLAGYCPANPDYKCIKDL